MRILLVEDNPGDARLIEELLREGGFERGSLEHATTLTEALARLEQGGVDVALLDLGLPDSVGFETFLRARQVAPAVPIVVLTGLAGDDLAIRAVQEGAQDYLVKDELNARLLWREIHFAVDRLRAVEAQRVAEQQLLQSQKMEAVGRLAGGVAHDFNNLLTAILGYAQLLSLRLKPGDHGHGEAEEIMKAATRASVLTRQLLAFSRREVVRRQRLDVNEVVAEVAKLIRRLIGEDVELVICPAANIGAILADSGQMEQVIMNLAINSRDAMPTGGRINIETSNVDVDETFADERFGLKAGPYVLLAVSDTGIGMDEETKSHLFEPFFTTKGRERGTGLGLSTVYGIITGYGGGIQVHSDPGFGTTFKLYFPRVEGRAERAPDSVEGRGLAGGHETILVVEDQDSVSAVVRGALSMAGYQVLVACNGNQALQIFNARPGSIDLVIADVIMPDMRGPEVVRRIRLVRPRTKALFISGYTEGAFLASESLPPGTSFLRKPFTPEALTAKVREAIDEGMTALR